MGKAMLQDSVYLHRRRHFISMISQIPHGRRQSILAYQRLYISPGEKRVRPVPEYVYGNIVLLAPMAQINEILWRRNLGIM